MPELNSLHVTYIVRDIEKYGPSAAVHRAVLLYPPFRPDIHTYWVKVRNRSKKRTCRFSRSFLLPCRFPVAVLLSHGPLVPHSRGVWIDWQVSGYQTGQLLSCGACRSFVSSSQPRTFFRSITSGWVRALASRKGERSDPAENLCERFFPRPGATSL